VACGHRLIFGCTHNTGSSTVAALACSLALPTLTSKITIYGWSTSAVAQGAKHAGRLDGGRQDRPSEQAEQPAGDGALEAAADLALALALGDPAGHIAPRRVGSCQVSRIMTVVCSTR
jgi:hypothetical protein